MEMARGMARSAEKEAQERERQRLERAAWTDIPFIETSVATTIFGMVERCFRFGENALVIGAPGVGKTRALEELLRRSENLEGERVALVTLTGTIGSSTMAIFEEVCPHLGVRPATSIAETQRRLMKSACFNLVVVFDEAQNLTLKAARDLLEISKASRIPMVFCGNSEILKLVNSAQAAIQQISRRIPLREEIACITDGDADLIANHFAVEGMDAYALCREIGRALHADGIATVLKEARRQAGEGRTVRLHHIREALEVFPHIKRATVEARARVKAHGRQAAVAAPARARLAK